MPFAAPQSRHLYLAEGSAWGHHATLVHCAFVTRPSLSQPSIPPPAPPVPRPPKLTTPRLTTISPTNHEWKPALPPCAAGSAIALALLSGGRLPLWAGVLCTAVVSFSLLFIERLGIRVLEVGSVFWGGGGGGALAGGGVGSGR